MRARQTTPLWALALLIAFDQGEARAYDFEVRARTVGQASSLRSLRFAGPNLFLSRRRISESLQLNIWNIGNPFATSKANLRVPFEPVDESGVRVSWSSYLRLDHDFGSFSSGQILIDGRLEDALDRIPELDRSGLEFDLLWAYASAEGVAGGLLDLYAGRQLELNSLDWFSFDGAKIRAHTPLGLNVEAFGGVRVREDSFLGTATQEPDGVSGALCQEYVEGAAPGSGSWRPVDRGGVTPSDPFASELERCHQREALMPTFGANLVVERQGGLSATLAYRRSQSQRPGLIGEVDRFEFEDRGYYPNEDSSLPRWGVNEELLSASSQYILELDKGMRLRPFASARYSLLHGFVDQAQGGIEGRRGAHRLEADLFYSRPAFDGDSIFNVFSSEPYVDGRLTWERAARESPWRGFARLWGRRFTVEEGDREQSSDPVAASDWSGGTMIGLRYRREGRYQLRADAFAEDGYGGRRLGGYLSGSWRASRRVSLDARLSLVDLRGDQRDARDDSYLGSQWAASYQVNKGMRASLLVEENLSSYRGEQLSLFALFDIAFAPET